jgi:hypothetical protein
MEETREGKLSGPKVSEYKGRPVLTLNPEDRFPFTFGLSKAKLIIQHLDSIKAFIEQQNEKGAGD